MKTIHTPGPWPITPLPENTWHVTAHIGPKEQPVAMVHGEANARLIATAPDLLAALKAMCEASEEQDLTALAMRIDRARDSARTAIAKATGKASL